MMFTYRIFIAVLITLLESIFATDTLSFLSPCKQEFIPPPTGGKTDIAYCIHGNGTDRALGPPPCQLGDYLSITHFTIHPMRWSKDNCSIVPPSNYKDTVDATCLQKVNQNLAKKIALIFIKAYNWESFENVSESEVQSNLNDVVPEKSLIRAEYRCLSQELVDIGFMDICDEQTIQGRNFIEIKLNTSSYANCKGAVPATCTCSVKSLRTNIAIRPVDVRLTTGTKLQTYQNNSPSTNIFPGDSTLFWPLDDPKIIPSTSVNIKLSMNRKRKLPDSIWLEIKGYRMNISCSYDFASTYDDKLDEYGATTNFGSFNGLLVSTVLLAVSTVVFLSVAILVSYKFYCVALKKQPGDCKYDQLNATINDTPAYQSLELNAVSARNDSHRSPRMDREIMDSHIESSHGIDSLLEDSHRMDSHIVNSYGIDNHLVDSHEMDSHIVDTNRMDSHRKRRQKLDHQRVGRQRRDRQRINRQRLKRQRLDLQRLGCQIMGPQEIGLSHLRANNHRQGNTIMESQTVCSYSTDSDWSSIDEDYISVLDKNYDQMTNHYDEIDQE